MIWVHLCFAIAVAVAFTVILLAVRRGEAYEREGWATAAVLFAVLFLTSWAGGIWLSPIGPQLFGAEWMPFLLMGLMVALLIAALSPLRRPRNRLEAREAVAAEEVVDTTLTAFFWIFAVCLVAAITLHYAYLDQQRAGHVAERQTNEALR